MIVFVGYILCLGSIFNRSFLNRFSMRRDSDVMRLEKKP